MTQGYQVDPSLATTKTLKPYLIANVLLEHGGLDYPRFSH